MVSQTLISKIHQASSKIESSSRQGKANWMINGDDIFGIYVCSGCCVIGTIVPSSGWGSSSSHEMICQGCGEKKKCHLMSQSDLIKIKTAIRDFKIGLLGI